VVCLGSSQSNEREPMPESAKELAYRLNAAARVQKKRIKVASVTDIEGPWSYSTAHTLYEFPTLESMLSSLRDRGLKFEYPKW
jgi:hypothetical protein